MNVLIVDDHPLVCLAIKYLLETEFNNIVVKSATSLKEAVNHNKKNKFDILIFDIELGSDNGFELLEKGFDCKSIVVSSKDENLYSLLAINAGVSGYVDKKENIERIVDAIKAVMSGYTYFRRLKGTSNKFNRPPKISAREGEVLRLLLDGHTNKEVARRLNISEKTVSTYKRRILDKYDVRSVFMIP